MSNEQFRHKQRVRFAESYEDMPDKLEVLVGDSGFVVNPGGQFNMGGKVLVQFDENKTGRPGGERHWIPTDCLEPESEGEADEMVSFTVEVTRPVAEQIVTAAALVGKHPVRFIEDATLNRLQAVDNIIHDETEHVELPDDFDPAAWRERYQHIRRLELYDE